MTASQPFTSQLVCSNIKQYKHHWIWVKEKGTGFQCAKYRPMMKTEDIIVFCNKTLRYNPQMVKREKPLTYSYIKIRSDSNTLRGTKELKTGKVTTDVKYPENILSFKTERGLHSTQKPVPLFEYLIKTYTQEGETVLDNCAGSGTTGLACKNTNRNYILIEKDHNYVEVINTRLSNM